VIKTPQACWCVHRSATGKARPFVRPDKSQNWGNGASRPGLSAVAAQIAATRDQPAPAGRESRLGEALAGLAQDLALARREIAVLKRENAALRSRLDVGGPR
jgi:hypothetical protein